MDKVEAELRGWPQAPYASTAAPGGPGRPGGRGEHAGPPPLPSVLLRIDDTTDPVDVDLCRLAATVVGVPLEVLIDDTAVVARLRDEQPPAVLRDLGAPSEQLGRAASEAGIDIDRRTPVALGEVELLHWSREQSVSETRHATATSVDPRRRRT